MISKSQIKLITSLQQKKYRSKTGLFIAEGPKIVRDFYQAGLQLEALFVVGSSEDYGDEYPFLIALSEEIVQVSQAEMQKISALKSANSVLAIFQIPNSFPSSEKTLVVALDAVRDPGNLGTIIRLCDWFGIPELICSPDTVDCYNPKVVQATMGSLARVVVSYLDLPEYIKDTQLPVYTAMMEGENVYKTQLPENAVLVMGNEANGVSKDILDLVSNKLTIPNFSKADAAESLNVATATGILISEFKRATEM